MKTRTFLKCTVLVTGLLCAAAFQAAAQPGPGGGGGRGGRGFGLPNATEEQTAAFRQMNVETADVQAKLMEARTALNDAIYAAKVDEAAIKEKAAAVAKVEADLSVARAKAFDKVRSKFTPEQIDALKQMGARGFGGRGGGRRGGGGGGGGGA